ncbi:Part of AAA domain-containing protein [Chryseobacterium taichungense]|uniref:DNA 3'-5' helicase II n=1 Tax=Chryseobacterium taichungense TaxID=295069 RepID=A0A1H8C660_9FLAO|nr:UvrD-helicase domain-containing protein [Chryseobacterium taichungense]SEM90565.1 Part of AAA domain-containing protein [Chryseobacterium taichungense]
MLQGIDITDDDIRYAERILLPEGKEFDDERKAFIRNLNTIDLQAVPGSGKTTALLAKLLIIERKLPFSDGSGILIISHTNTAIDEIKEKVQKHCPKLFSYPNFIGTIQSFVDTFLAIPMFVHWKGKKPIRIDSEIFWESLHKSLPYGSRLALEKRLGNKFKQFMEELSIGPNDKLFHFDSFEEISIPKIGSHTDTYKNLFAVKKRLLNKGILNYSDAFTLANIYLNKHNSIKSLLQKRFSFVFVDEMQDMDTHQYNLLEKVFYDDGNSISIIQRIGDKNQAIYNSVKAIDVWEDRAEVLRLNGSQRLSKPIANFVKRFALYNDVNFNIVGMNVCVIKPHILKFENETIGNLIPQFAHIVKAYKEQGSFTNPERPIKVVCWNTDWKEDDTSRQDDAKLRLEDYHIGFRKEKSKPKQDYDCLKSYLLFYDKSKQTLEPLRKNILNSFLKILRLENINTLDGRPYTKKKLIDFIRVKDHQKYEELKLNIYNWSMGVIKGNANDVFEGIRAYIPNFFAIFSEAAPSTSISFINNDTTRLFEINVEKLEISNHYKEQGLEIEITSVHAVKGQTHCATLYLESYFQGNYESERLTNQFLGNAFDDKRVHHKSSTKMAYVGFSRPTDLLCIAVHKDRFDKYLSGINKEEWEIIDIQNDR